MEFANKDWNNVYFNNLRPRMKDFTMQVLAEPNKWPEVPDETITTLKEEVAETELELLKRIETNNWDSFDATDRGNMCDLIRNPEEWPDHGEHHRQVILAHMPELAPQPSPDETPSPEGGAQNPADEDSESSGNSDETANMVAQALDFVYPEYDIITEEDGWDHCVQSAFKLAVDNTDPKSYWEALARPDSHKWIEAAKAEMDTLIKNGTGERVQLPPDRKSIGSKWVFKIKRDADGNIKKYKGRLVAQGFSQRPGIDFIEDQTFAPTMRFAALRSILNIVAQEDWELESVDVDNAYLNGDMPADQVVYMRQAPGFEEEGNDWVYRLKKGLYGLKQAG